MRAYACIKTLVSAAHKSSTVKEYLLRDPDRWQWSVNWLKDKMSGSEEPWSTATGSSAVTSSTRGSGTSAGSGSGGGQRRSGGGRSSWGSNEDASSRTFHRTTSAQVTLDEAKAILAEVAGGVREEEEEEEDRRMETEEEQHQVIEDSEMPDLQEITPKE